MSHLPFVWLEPLRLDGLIILADNLQMKLHYNILQTSIFFIRIMNKALHTDFGFSFFIETKEASFSLKLLEEY